MGDKHYTKIESLYLNFNTIMYLNKAKHKAQQKLLN